MAKVAFIGLGNMGGPMAANLVKANHQVTVFDLSSEAMKQLSQEGARVANSANDCVKDADFVISMLPAGKHVVQLYLGDNGVLQHIKENALVIDSSTIDAESAKKVAVELAKNSIRFVDAPVSGGVGGATAGSLSFMVGGAAEDFEASKAVLNDMGANLFHAGDHGAGQIAKVCNNMLLSVLMVGTSEALQLGIANGLDPSVLSTIMQQSSGANWTLDKYNPCPNILPHVPSSNNYQGGFMVDLMAKDLGLAMDTALQSSSSTPMGALARSLYVMHSNAGEGKKDFSSIFNLFNREIK